MAGTCTAMQCAVCRSRLQHRSEIVSACATARQHLARRYARAAPWHRCVLHMTPFASPQMSAEGMAYSARGQRPRKYEQCLGAQELFTPQSPLLRPCPLALALNIRPALWQLHGRCLCYGIVASCACASRPLQHPQNAHHAYTTATAPPGLSTDCTHCSCTPNANVCTVHCPLPRRMTLCCDSCDDCSYCSHRPCAPRPRMTLWSVDCSHCPYLQCMALCSDNHQVMTAPIPFVRPPPPRTPSALTTLSDQRVGCGVQGRWEWSEQRVIFVDAVVIAEGRVRIWCAGAVGAVSAQAGWCSCRCVGNAGLLGMVRFLWVLQWA